MTATEDVGGFLSAAEVSDALAKPPGVTDSTQLRVLRADNGFDTPLARLASHSGRPVLLWSVDSHLRLTQRPLTIQISVGERDVYSLRLASGRCLELASNHSVRKLEGWTSVPELDVGSRVAVVRRVDEPVQTDRMHNQELIMLAHMIGDGSCVRRQPVRYASIDEANLDAVTTAALHFGVTAIRDEYAAARVTTLRLPAPYRLTHGKRNPIAEWLDGLGLFGLRSYEKFVPAKVFAAPNDQVALFLRHLWATDGSVRWDAKTAQGRVYYASTSRRLIDDVMQLLLRMGVQGRITETQKASYRACWHLTIDRGENQLAFLTDVGVHGERGIKAQEVVARLAGRDRRPGTDTIPIQIWEHVKALMVERNWSAMDFALATNTRFDGPLMWTHAPGRARMQRIANVFGDPLLHDLATNDIVWDKVVSLEHVGYQERVDFGRGVAGPLVVGGLLVEPQS
ncbi:hypothetical protein FR943_04135 [Mycobacterium sp. TNTM28]|uniref:DOD-type homing endonuclease domain-containing protein n=1 Tax=[Mycobacterium] fortunisiensis TaxID=2600579 RepID=A0ABS6KHI5_9MYCO|nr:LAGLIDADG family homing endonuclease [[Mycobacterium] fortunisiensis]MBU9763037.1 hypothetical protein [[Mycobacterium] fortunisiensis]